MAEQETPPKATATAPAGGERVSICGGRYEVLANTPLPQFDPPSGQAFATQASRGASGLIAFVIRPGELPRHEMMPHALNVNTPGILRFIESDVVFWPRFNRQVPVLLYDKPAGAKLMASLLDERPPLLNNEIAFRQIVEGLHGSLRDLYLASCNHGCINPTNIYARDVTGTQLQLGDFLSSQPGFHQESAYETIERLMAHPVARGPVSSSEDIYAVGVTLLTLLFGRLPVALLDDEALVQAKVEKGSLMALLGGMRLPSAYSELMRGLLHDDIKQRWNLDDIGHWLGGRRLGSKPSGQTKKAQRSFEFAGQNFINPRLLAQAISRQPEQGIKVITDSSLDRWLRRSLGDENKAEAVSEAAASATSVSRGGTAQERIVGRVTIALDPGAPIRFRDIAALPAGLGALLAYHMMNNKSPGAVAELISGQFVNYWVNSQSEFVGENTTLLQTFDGVRILMERAQIGFGIERAAYELNPMLPCLSPMIESEYAITLKAVMIALENMAATVKPEEKREPMDRHLAAFVLSRHRRMNARLFPLLAPKSDPGQRAIAILTILAELQRKFHPDDTPHLGEWMARLLTPAMERFHNRPLREKMLRDLRRLAKRGDLDAMLQLVDDGNTMKKDEEGFAAARTQYIAIERIIRELGAGSSREKALTIQGRQITAFFSCLMAFAIIGLMIFLQMV